MQDSKIEWTDHTFNPWMGCTKVSPLCEHCYAETMMDTRYGRVTWGPQGTRVRTSKENWRKPLKWDRDARAEGQRRRVFCASLADVFEDRDELLPWRSELFELIDRTTQLDWLLLTKRPERIGRMWPAPRHETTGDGRPVRAPESTAMSDLPSPAQSPAMGDGASENGACANVAGPPRLATRSHVWLGTSVGTQRTAAEAIPRLVQWRALVPILFLSIEPLLEAIPRLDLTHIDWVIVGGESGAAARPMAEAWVEEIREQCHAAGTKFFFKQWGGVNKKRHGRELAGRTWDEIPSP